MERSLLDSLLRLRRLELRCINDRPEVDHPPKQDEPQQRGQDKVQHSHSKPRLQELSQSGYEETAEGCDYVSG